MTLNAQTERDRQERLARGADRTVHQRPAHAPGVRETMRFVAIAGEVPVVGEDRRLAVYPLTRQGHNFFIVVEGGEPTSNPEIMRVWPHMLAVDFVPLFLATGEDDGFPPPFPKEFDPETGQLSTTATLCPAYLVDGEWWVHNTVRMSWAVPQLDAVFSSCGGREREP